MAKSTNEYYRGKRKKTGGALVLPIIALTLLAFVILLFYGLQKFIVVTNEGLYLDIPFASERHRGSSDEGDVTGDFEQVTAQLNIGEPDYSNIKATAGEGLEAVKAILVPYESVTMEGLAAYAENMGSANTLLLDLKTSTGALAWTSKTEIALGYGTSGRTELAPIIKSLHDKNIRVAARLCCFTDDLLASRYAQVTLHDSDGKIYVDDDGAWLDPTSSIVRRYIADLCRELSSMGVDEIVLKDLRLPETDKSFSFSSNTSAVPTPETAIAGFAISLARSLNDVEAKLCVQIYSQSAMQGLDSVTGQNAKLFLKVYDRVYRLSSLESASAEQSAAMGLISVGDAAYRFVPICYDGKPETASWLYMGG